MHENASATIRPAASTPAARVLRSPWIVALPMFVLFVYLGTRGNDFPVYYLTNDPSNAKEVIKGLKREHAFRQPLLLTTTGRMVMKVLNVDRDLQSVVVMGRWIAAIFAGLGLVAMALLAFQWRGLLGALCVGAVLATWRDLIHFSHFFKEDTALLMGLSLAFLAMDHFWRTRTTLSILLLGAASALAMAGKFVGLFAVPFALTLLLIPPAQNRLPGRGQRIMLFLLAFAIAYVLANWPITQYPRHFLNAVTYEIRHAFLGVNAEGYVRTEIGKPLQQNWKSFLLVTAWPIRVLLGMYVVMLVGTWRRRSAPERALALFPFVFVLAVVTFSKLQSLRHMLPAWYFFHVLAGLAIADLALLIRRIPLKSPSWPPIARAAAATVAIAALAAAIWGQARQTRELFDEYQRDSRDLLRQWVRTLPASAKIAQDWDCALPDPTAKAHNFETRTYDQELLTSIFAADLGTLQELRERGVTHVAISHRRFGGLFRDNRDPVVAERERHERRRAFYEELQQSGNLVWNSWQQGSPKGGFSGQKILVYEISGPRRPDAGIREENPLYDAGDAEELPEDEES